jgi:6-pyruvoyltetrahydropterin/6-carboxytetrahydropterin synthase
MLTVTKHFGFEACHHLPYYEGACHNVHGHSYKLDVTVGGQVIKDGPKQGMIIDFKDLKKIVKENVVDKLDHSDLNEFYANPTAELMVTDIAYSIMQKLPKEVYLVSVKLWETEDSYAEYIPSYDSLRDNLLQPVLQPAT